MTSDTLRALLERRQTTIYFAAVALAFLSAWAMPGLRALSAAIDPLLALMLFATFLQVPMGELRRAWADFRFVGALLLANFILIPLLVTLLLPWTSGDPLIRIALLLVTLTPCVDYVVTFAHLGRADSRSLLAATPFLLAAQMLLLPVYLGVLLGPDARALVSWQHFVHAFIFLIAIPLMLAGACQAWEKRSGVGARTFQRLGLLPVPATAAVLGVVVASVTPELGPALPAVSQTAPFYLAFALVAPALGWLAGTVCGLARPQKLACAFSAATRNSLVVLPLGLAIPGALPVIPAVIVTQTLVELLAELVYVSLAKSRRLAG